MVCAFKEVTESNLQEKNDILNITKNLLAERRRLDREAEQEAKKVAELNAEIEEMNKSNGCDKRIKMTKEQVLLELDVDSVAESLFNEEEDDEDDEQNSSLNDAEDFGIENNEPSKTYKFKIRFKY